MSRETDSIIAYVRSVNPDVVVTAVLGHYVSPSNPCSPHSPTSNHCAQGTEGKGLAVDWGGTEKQIMNAYNALKLVFWKLSELIHNAPGITQAVKDGHWVNGVQGYGAVAWAAHKNHAHSAVPKGVFLVPVAPAPPTPHIGAQYVNLHLDIVASAKTVDGRVYLAQADGSIFGFEVPGIGGPNGQPYFLNRKVARLYNNAAPEVPANARGNGDGLGLAIQTESNEWYGVYYT